MQVINSMYFIDEAQSQGFGRPFISISLGAPQILFFCLLVTVNVVLFLVVPICVLVPISIPICTKNDIDKSVHCKIGTFI